jgi:hypothetical protein
MLLVTVRSACEHGPIMRRVDLHVGCDQMSVGPGCGESRESEKLPWEIREAV